MASNIHSVRPDHMHVVLMIEGNFKDGTPFRSLLGDVIRSTNAYASPTVSNYVSLLSLHGNTSMHPKIYIHVFADETIKDKVWLHGAQVISRHSSRELNLTVYPMNKMQFAMEHHKLDSIFCGKHKKNPKKMKGTCKFSLRKAFLYQVLPENVPAVLVLDIDLRIYSNLWLLWHALLEFGPNQLVSIAFIF